MGPEAGPEAGSGPEPGPAPAPGPAVEVVDARGLRCPLPVIRLAARAKELPPGTVLAVVSTDPAARLDVPAWARMRGHDLVGTEVLAEDPGVWRVTVRLR